MVRDRHFVPTLERLRRCLYDVSNLLGLRGEDGMAGYNLSDSAARTPRHLAFQLCAMDDDDVFDLGGLRRKCDDAGGEGECEVEIECRFMRFTPVVVK